MAPAHLHGVRALEAHRRSRPKFDVRWPEPDVLQSLVAVAAREELGGEGLDPELFSLPLELAAIEALDVVKRCDWPGGSRRLLGLEVEGEAALDLPAGARHLTFRADRIERIEREGRGAAADRLQDRQDRLPMR